MSAHRPNFLFAVVAFVALLPSCSRSETPEALAAEYERGWANGYERAILDVIDCMHPDVPDLPHCLGTSARFNLGGEAAFETEGDETYDSFHEAGQLIEFASSLRR